MLEQWRLGAACRTSTRSTGTVYSTGWRARSEKHLKTLLKSAWEQPVDVITAEIIITIITRLQDFWSNPPYPETAHPSQLLISFPKRLSHNYCMWLCSRISIAAWVSLGWLSSPSPFQYHVTALYSNPSCRAGWDFTCFISLLFVCFCGSLWFLELVCNL